MDKIRVAVLGATGMVGQYFLHLLHDHPFFQVAAVCASDARIGQLLGQVRPLHPAGIAPELAEMRFTSERMAPSSARVTVGPVPGWRFLSTAGITSPS